MRSQIQRHHEFGAKELNFTWQHDSDYLRKSILYGLQNWKRNRNTVEPETYDHLFYDHLLLTTTFSGPNVLPLKEIFRQLPPVKHSDTFSSVKLQFKPEHKTFKFTSLEFIIGVNRSEN